MATKLDLQPKGSWTLKAVILLLIVFLLASILYPKKLWKEYADLTQLSRARMTNLNTVEQRFKKIVGYYTANSDSLIQFMKSDSVKVGRPVLDYEILSLFDAPNDSILIGFPDRFHFEKFAIEEASSDSIIISILPKAQFEKILPPGKFAIKGEKQVQYFPRNKGEEDITYIIWSRGKVVRTELPYDTLNIPSKDYLIDQPVDEINTDPISNQLFTLTRNSRINMHGEIRYVVALKGTPAQVAADNELITNLLINRLARTARAKLDAALKKDSTLYASQLSLQNDYFEVELQSIRPGTPVLIDGDKEMVVPSTDVDQFHDPVKIKEQLFAVSYDSLIRVWTNREDAQALLKNMDYTEAYLLNKSEVIGVTITVPFEESFTLTSRSIWDRIWSVGPVKNPGKIENSDPSWGGKK